MDAMQARAIADVAAAQKRVISLLNTIEQAAKEGSYSYLFGILSDEAHSTLRLLGFTVETDGGNTRVSWKK